MEIMKCIVQLGLGLPYLPPSSKPPPFPSSSFNNDRATRDKATSMIQQQQQQPRRELLLLRRPERPTPISRKIVSKSSSNDDDDRSSSRCTPWDVLRLMDSLELPVDAELYLALVRECTISGDTMQAARIHSHVHRGSSTQTLLSLTNRLILMHAACGSPAIMARQLFDRLPQTHRDILSYAAMIAVLTRQADLKSRHSEEACKLFLQMLLVKGNRRPISILHAAAVSVLRCCVRSKKVELAKQMHALLLKIPQVQKG